MVKLKSQASVDPVALNLDSVYIVSLLCDVQHKGPGLLWAVKTASCFLGSGTELSESAHRYVQTTVSLCRPLWWSHISMLYAIA
jgi:hypothetical protein